MGMISAEPDARIGQARYVVRATTVSLNNSAHAVHGKILVTAPLYPTYQYGDKVAVACKAYRPENQDGSTFRYDKYLGKDGIWLTCLNPTITAVSSGNGNFLFRNILIFKSAVQEKIEKLWSEPEASFMAGLLYGSKAGLPPELMDNFSKTGLTHIIAVSGFNVTIIATVLMTVLIYCGLWRQQAFWATIFGILLFIIFTGLSASAVRAGIMATVVLTGQYLGRLSRMGNVLVFTAALMMLVNPYVLAWDAGFQLSFLATLGLVYLSPVLLTVIPNAREESLSVSSVSQRFFAEFILSGANVLKMTIRVTRDPFIQTLSAIISTLPLILYQFGRLSLVAPLVNVLILWIIPPLMLLGFGAIVFSFMFFPLGHLVAWFAHIGLQYVIILVNWFGERSWSAAQFQLPWWGMTAMYIILIWYVQKKRKNGIVGGRV